MIATIKEDKRWIHDKKKILMIISSTTSESFINLVNPLF